MEIVLLWFLFGFVCAYGAGQKGKSKLAWFFWGILLGPFALIALLFAKSVDSKVISEAEEISALKNLHDLRQSGAIDEQEYMRRKKAFNSSGNKKVETSGKQVLLVLAGFVIFIFVFLNVFGNYMSDISNNSTSTKLQYKKPVEAPSETDINKK